MADHRAELRETLRKMEAATGEAAATCLPRLLARLRHHEDRLPGHLLIRPWRRWRIRRLADAVAEARWHVEQGWADCRVGLRPNLRTGLSVVQSVARVRRTIRRLRP